MRLPEAVRGFLMLPEATRDCQRSPICRIENFPGAFTLWRLTSGSIEPLEPLSLKAAHIEPLYEKTLENKINKNTKVQNHFI